MPAPPAVTEPARPTDDPSIAVDIAVDTQVVCIVRNRQWRYWRNIRNSATAMS